MKKTFLKKVIAISIFPNIAASVIIVLYTLLTIQFKFSHDLNFSRLIRTFLEIIFILQFVIAPIADYLLYYGVSMRLDDFYSMETDKIYRTNLYLSLMRIPLNTAVVTFSFFLIGSFSLAFFTHLEFKNIDRVLFFIECLYGSYFSSLIAFTIMNQVCSKEAINIINKGIDEKFILNKKYFGTTLFSQILFYVFIPTTLSCIIDVAVVISGYFPLDKPELRIDPTIQTSRMIITCLFNTILIICSILIFGFRYKKREDKMTESLDKMLQSNFSLTNTTDTDISDEISYTQYLANNITQMFNNIIHKVTSTSIPVLKSSNELTRISNETETTSIEQSTGTKEIVSTMEVAADLARNIKNRISEVTEYAQKTANDVNNGSDLLSKVLEYSSIISQKNKMTTEEIKRLNEKINSIWDIISIINGISDQTKIIAFNAELESCQNSITNKNFRNVSNEIRHLANSTLDSTNEIKEKILDLQKASSKLIADSINNTMLIEQEKITAAGLETKFSNIKKSTEVNSDSAEDIQYLIEEQTEAFEQILSTLQQISESIQNFSISTKTIIETSENLENTISKLNKISTYSAEGEF